MEKVVKEALFKPALSKSESKAEAISRSALAMIDQEVAAREEKTARLREARLAKEEAERIAPPAAPATTKRAAAKRR